MSLEQILEFLNNKFNLNDYLLPNVKSYLEHLFKKHLDKASLLKEDSFSMLTNDELIIEWMFSNSYFQMRIKKDDLRCDVRFKDGSRFAKYHPVPAKLINATNQCLDRLIEESNG